MTRSTTATLAGWTLATLALIALAILVVALVTPEAATVVAPALAQVALAVAGGGGAGTVAYGIRHWGTAAPTSRQVRYQERTPAVGFVAPDDEGWDDEPDDDPEGRVGFRLDPR